MGPFFGGGLVCAGALLRAAEGLVEVFWAATAGAVAEADAGRGGAGAFVSVGGGVLGSSPLALCSGAATTGDES